MRVCIGRRIDVDHNFSLDNLTFTEKISAIWGASVKDSKILGNKKKREEDQLLRKRTEKINGLRDSILASEHYYLHENNVLKEMNLVAGTVELAIDRANSDLLDEVLSSIEFNVFHIERIPLDHDLVNSFGDKVPIIISIQKLEMVDENSNLSNNNTPSGEVVTF